MPVNPFYLRDPQAACGTKGRRLAGGGGERGDHTLDKEKDIREDGGENSDCPSAGNNSGASGVSFTGDDNYLMESADGKSEEEEDSWGW